MYRLLLHFFLVCLVVGWCGAAPAQPRLFTLLTYNTENTFDTIPAPDGRDAEFLPEGSHHWGRWRYMDKLCKVAQVMLAADSLHPVDLAVLQEVESDTVLSDLLHRTPLASIPYEYILTRSADSRGINVAVVYSPFTFHLLATDTLSLGTEARTRQVLYVCGQLSNGDTLHLYALHLPSQLGGAKAQRRREELCRKIGAHIETSTRGSNNPLVVVCGDFNDSPSAKCIRRLCQRAGLTNLMQGRKGGSYKWQGCWQWLDQTLLSPTLLQPEHSTRLAQGSPSLVQSSFLLEKDTTYGGDKPMRSFFGPIWHGGYSDHLPVRLQFVVE